MDIAKENPVTFSDRTGVKGEFLPLILIRILLWYLENVSETVSGNLVAFSASKRLTALSDVRNTVHKKNVAEPSTGKQFLEIETRRDLETTSPRRKQTPLVKRFGADVNVLAENLDDYVFTACRCNLNDESSYGNRNNPLFICILNFFTNYFFISM